MNPDKLFDYLDGKLSSQERSELERQLAADTYLQRQLVIAREIHSRMRSSCEVLLEDDATAKRGAILGRRVAIAFAVLVFMNVVFGLYAIGFLQKKKRARPAEEQNRKEFAQALDKAAAAALPVPTLDVDEIKIDAPAKQRDAMANKVMAAAKQSGGSAVKNLSDENGSLLFAEIPAERVEQFRGALKKLGAILPASTSANATSGKAILQIRINEVAK
jgi:anti-sigma factor RsiW